MKVLIVEDEKDHEESLISMIRSIDTSLQILPVASNIEDAKANINNFHPDIIFMDIDLKGRKSFEILDDIQFHDFSLIFTTAHDKYAVNAFRLNAIDYLLKPINKEELSAAIKKVKTARNTSSDIEWKQLQNVLLGKEKMKKISLPSANGIDFVNIDEIIRCEADGNYTKFITSTEHFLSSKTIGEYDEALSLHGFFRIHKSHLVNLQFVKRLTKDETLLLKNDEKLPVARRRKETLIEMLSKI